MAVATAVLYGVQLTLALSSAVAPGVDAVSQSIAWFASGVGVAGVWLLGWPGFVAVVAATVTQRLLINYVSLIAVCEAFGSGLEALVGAWVLRRCGVRLDFSRLRDVCALALAAGVAPFVSMAVSLVARSLDRVAAQELGFLSGWIGWWRMNALGVVIAVPTVLAWHGQLARSRGLRTLLDTCLFVVGAALWLAFVISFCPATSTSITLLHAVFVFALMAALRHGPVGANTVAAFAATIVAVATTRGFGPFQSVPFEDRHAAAQVFLLVLAIVPLVFGALVAGQRELEAQLRQAHKLEAVGLLAGGLAHDFNNLLTIVAGNAAELREQSPPGSAAAARAVEIADAAVRGAGLTRQLLAFSRQQVIKPQDLELGAVVVQMTSMLRRLLGADVVIDVVTEAEVWVRADRGQLEQVVMNLAINSRDAMPSGGSVTITTRSVQLTTTQAAYAGLDSGPFAELEVHDTGHGMSAEVHAHAFEPFFTTKAQGRGTGLGLATVYGIARQSRGGVVIDSDTSRGTTVRLWLPSLPAPTPAAAPPSLAAAATPGPRRVLVVDDEPAVRDLLRRLLQSAGHQVLEAENGEAALAVVAAEGPIDLLVTDIAMPQLGGFALARRLCEARPSLPVLFVSAHPRNESGIDLAEFGRSAFVAKPFGAAAARHGGAAARGTPLSFARAVVE